MCAFEKGTQDQHFQSTPLVGREGGHRREYYVYILDTVDISGRPIMYRCGTDSHKHFLAE